MRGFRPAAEVSPDPALSLAERWDTQFWEGRKLLQNLLDIEAPMIAAVNGPALVHSGSEVLPSKRPIFG